MENLISLLLFLYASSAGWAAPASKTEDAQRAIPAFVTVAVDSVTARTTYASQAENICRHTNHIEYSSPGWNGPTLLVCTPKPTALGAAKYRVEPGEIMLVAARMPDGSLQELFNGSESDMAFELEPLHGCSIAVTKNLVYKSKAAQARQNRSAQYFPLIRNEISCQKDGCKVSAKTCVLNSQFTAATVDIPAPTKQDIFSFELKLRRQVDQGVADAWEVLEDTLDDIAYRLLLKALAGDPEARQLLLNFPIPLDGHYSEILGTYADDYNEAVKLGCQNHR